MEMSSTPVKSLKIGSKKKEYCYNFCRFSGIASGAKAYTCIVFPIIYKVQRLSRYQHSWFDLIIDVLSEQEII